MDSWQRFIETLPDKIEIYSNVNMEDIMNTDYKHAKKVWKDFKLKNIGIMICTYKVIHYC